MGVLSDYLTLGVGAGLIGPEQRLAERSAALSRTLGLLEGFGCQCVDLVHILRCSAGVGSG